LSPFAALLALIEAAPREIAALSTLYGEVKGAIGSRDQATLDAALAAIGARLDNDVAALDRAASLSR
jgi:hypothetical protein